MRTENLPNDVTRLSFDSLADLAATAERHIIEGDVPRVILKKPDWLGCKDWQAGIALARDGWAEELTATLDVAESAIRKVEAEHTMDTFVPTFDVCGVDVDVARYLSGEPECMVDYPLTPIVKAGRVITLCVGSGISSVIS